MASSGKQTCLRCGEQSVMMGLYSARAGRGVYRHILYKDLRGHTRYTRLIDPCKGESK